MESLTRRLVSRRREDSGSLAVPGPSRKAELWGITWPTCCASDDPWSKLTDGVHCAAVPCVIVLRPAGPTDGTPLRVSRLAAHRLILTACLSLILTTLLTLILSGSLSTFVDKQLERSAENAAHQECTKSSECI